MKLDRRVGVLRWWLRIPQFFRRRGELFDRLEHLIYSEHWEYPTNCTWRVVGQPMHNRPYECERRTRAKEK
jgi:hypothetical protein